MLLISFFRTEGNLIEYICKVFVFFDSLCNVLFEMVVFSKAVLFIDIGFKV